MKKFPSLKQQNGAALIICLIILVLVTLMGLTTMKSSTLQEKISGGNSDKALAMQAAELALRSAESNIRYNLTPTSGFTDGCKAGLCNTPYDGTSTADTVDWDGGEVIEFGKKNVPKLVDGVTKQPKYIIELLAPMMPLPGGSVGAKSDATPYRITVVAYGRQENTRVQLQSTFYKPKNR